ncbi:hypothetical protein KFL_000170250 [Klebsormidium nitens]|uniref:Ankyrin repeat family protein n=1 Tax=Klebsormidium nitens TaxID=105231 RepID=A0A1Y1HNC0_KLENI|nr:hypothetical protein KFL_000170250 [Klebsormidium nitens]|eukprot:GAQ78679.1 hypothetical protein KFL_000170250 [Klebsormidium nitens]
MSVEEDTLRRLRNIDSWLTALQPDGHKYTEKGISTLQEYRPTYSNIGFPRAAIDNEHFDVVDYLSKKDVLVRELVFPLAALLESLNGLKWAKVQGMYQWGEDSCQHAVLGGSLEVLQWLREQTPPCPWDATLCIALAAQMKSFAIAEWVLGQDPSAGKTLCNVAAKAGFLDALAWARKHGLPWDEGVCTGAAMRGQFAALRWLRKRSPPCPWHPSLCAFFAAEEKQFEMAQWVLKKARSAAPSVCAYAACLGSMHVLEWARKRKLEWGNDACVTAAMYGQLDTLKWLRAHGCPWEAGRCAFEAINHGRLEEAEWIVEQEEDALADMCILAAMMGKLPPLVWASKRVPPSSWEKDVCLYAARAGSLKILTWARSQVPPSPWNPLRCIYGACARGHNEVADWVLKQEPMVRPFVCDIAAARGEVQALRWARSLDPPCPWDLERCLRSAALEGVSDQELLSILEAEPVVQLSREYCAEVAKEDRIHMLRFLLDRGCYRYVLRPGLNAGPLCARLARKMLVPLDKESTKRASDMFKRQVALSAGLQTYGIFGDVAEKIGLLAELSWL